jgi:hypothetical protein
LQHLAANRAARWTWFEELPLVLRSARTAPEARRYLHDLQPATLGESAPCGDTEGKVECFRVDTRKLAQEEPRRNNATATILIGSAQSNLNHPLGYRYLVHSGLRASIDSNGGTPDLVDNHVHCAGAGSLHRFVQPLT